MDDLRVLIRDMDETTDFVSQSIPLLIVARLLGFNLARAARLPNVFDVPSELCELVLLSSRDDRSDCALFGTLGEEPRDVDSVVEVQLDLFPIEPSDDVLDL